MKRPGSDDWQAYIGELRAFKAAKDRHESEDSPDSAEALDAALADLAERIDDEDLASVLFCLEMHGDALIEALAARDRPDLPAPTDFERAIASVEAAEIMDACVRLDVAMTDARAILMGYINGRENGRDEFAEHGQDAEALVRFHLTLLDEARREGRSRGY